jgi:hypothetical protein
MSPGKEIEKRGKRGVWFPEGNYSMHADKALMDLASSRLPLAMRLYFLASARMNRWGHASFQPGEMRRLLECSPNSARNAINTLATNGVAEGKSTTLCVVISAIHARRGDATNPSNAACIEPRHMDRQRLMWIAGIGWESEPGQWHGDLESGQAATRIKRTVERERIIERERITEEVVRAPVAIRHGVNDAGYCPACQWWGCQQQAG